MPKKLIYNSYSGQRSDYIRKRGVRLTKPDGEVLSLGEIVAMHMRGQDVSLYARPVSWGSIEASHDDLDFESIERMDLAERSEFARSHGMLVDSLKRQLDDHNAALKAAADAELVRLKKEELEKPLEVSRAKKFSKKTDDVNDDE